MHSVVSVVFRLRAHRVGLVRRPWRLKCASSTCQIAIDIHLWGFAKRKRYSDRNFIFKIKKREFSVEVWTRSLPLSPTYPFTNWGPPQHIYGAARPCRIYLLLDDDGAAESAGIWSLVASHRGGPSREGRRLFVRLRWQSGQTYISSCNGFHRNLIELLIIFNWKLYKIWVWSF